MDILDGFNAKNNELHFMDEIKYTLYSWMNLYLTF